MTLWAISDLHLSFSGQKPMDVFGPEWQNHVARIEAAWRELVGPEDVVCLPGDFSWAMRLSDVGEELRWLGGLPGRKVLVKGNHDYWWESLSKVRRALPEGVYAIQNDAVVVEGIAFAGARGWVDPSLSFGGLCAGPGEDEGARLFGIRGEEEDERIYRRELDRLENSLRALPKECRLRVALLHFPPTSPALESTPVTELLERHGVDVVVFGHLHGPCAGYRNPYGRRNGVQYFLASADFVGFSPVLVADLRAPSQR
ncbi:MAG: metallophosphoesterase [Deltaproteobacteria bacterium]|nr:metallophosphoesterase [Deltaproteobacteria bacterium]